MKRAYLTALVLSLPAGAFALGQQQEPPDIDFQFKVDQAIDKGIASLNGKHTGSFHDGHELRYQVNGNELILLTYLHAGAPERYPNNKTHFEALLKYVLESKLERTYKVTLTAMSLEEYDRVKYQWRIHQCAQFLADNVDPTGVNRYGAPTLFVDEIKPVPTGDRRKDVSTSSSKAHPVGVGASTPEPQRRQKPPVAQIIQVKRQRPGPSDHDHSNMQYHALGLRACHDAGMRFEPDLLKLIEKHWRETQVPDAGAKEEPLQLDLQARVGNAKRASGPTMAMIQKIAAPAGWNYSGEGTTWGSMTVGAVGALCIFDYLLGKDWREDKDVLEGLQWIHKHFSVTENPGLPSKWYLYYMYGLERVGMLFGTETIGSHKWYREGAEELLRIQEGNGSWGNVVDTCFAILFLRRATRPLGVATGARRP